MHNNIKMLQDWKPYNESIIWELADYYFQNKGTAVFSKKVGNAIPHNINTNYPNALSIAKLVKAAIDQYPNLSSFMVLETGAGSGYFSMHFLHALKDLGLQGKVKLIISDYSKLMIQEIKASKIVEDFIEGKDYELVVLDVLKPEEAKYLNGENFKFNNLLASIMNYVFDTLPVTILKKKANAEFEELYLRINQASEGKYEPLENSQLLTNLVKDLKFHDYKASSQSEIEKKYYEDFKEFYQDANTARFIPFTYSVLEAATKLLALTLEKGFLFSADIPPLANSFCQIVGNAVAHEIDNEFIAYYFSKTGNFSVIQTDSILSRIVLTNNLDTAHLLNKSFEENFVIYNSVKRYRDLQEVLVRFEFKESMDCMKYILQEFERLAGPNSLYTWLYWATYHLILDEDEKAIAAYKKARKLDYLDSYSLDTVIARIESLKT